MGVDLGYRGEQLGLPKEGPGSVAPLGRRVGAIAVDWGLCVLIASSLITGSYGQTTSSWALLILFVLNLLTLGTLGFTPGKRFFRLRVVGVDGGRLGVGRALVRSILLCLAIPALIWDRDSRGLHDRLARAVQVRI
ncbi:RDD family protein [Streptomyces jeddahensis]|uniref:RDD family protein n=2 Tax=Streptomyces jeddahensis TaxID=1716141 RepID=A0A177HZ90_9ACTN|nr:RDD family protein [Streptomyces jeddahensis]